MHQSLDSVHPLTKEYKSEKSIISPNLSVRKSALHGFGCFSTVRFLQGSFIAEYAGEKITRSEAMLRMRTPSGGRISELNCDRYIDGAINGNETQFINHSCDPNADASVLGESLIIFALRDIWPGEEITVDYLNSFEQDYSVCGCRAISCLKRGRPAT